MWGIIAITQNGLKLAKQLQEQFPESIIYTLQKWNDPDVAVIEGELGVFTRKLFHVHRTLIFIMAAGIVVRSISRHLTDKTIDPAVVVMDEKGHFAISLLSGHLGGANEVTTTIAEKLNLIPVITTASDVLGLPSVDMIAKTHQLHIESMKCAKIISAMIVNGFHIAMRNETLRQIPSYFTKEEQYAKGLIIISNRQVINENLPYARLTPKNITIGIGCKRGISGEKIIAFITEQLAICNISLHSLCCLASIELKSNETGIHEAARHFGIPTMFIPTSEIITIENQFSCSEFVKSHTGVSAVCEPASFIAGGTSGKFIIKKQSKEGMTLAIFESAK